MAALPLTPFTVRIPLWLICVALGGVAWNLFGAVQFVGAASATTERVASGLAPAQAAVMTGYPAWMTMALS